MIETTDELVGRLVRWLQTLAPPQDRITSMISKLRNEFGGDQEPLTAEIVDRVEQVARTHCRHLELHFQPESTLEIDHESPGWPPEDEEPIRRRAAYVSAVRRTDEGVAIIAVDNLAELTVAEPYLDAAIALAAGATGVLLDLRRNGGGDPATVAKIIGWLCGPDVRISTVVYRNHTRAWTTPSTMTLPAGTPVVIMIGPGTYSSGEALAYHLQSLDRGPLVGQRTPGAADHVTPIILTAHVHGLLPEAYAVDARTGGNWEGIGVVPDIEAEPDDVEARAFTALRRE